MKTLKKFWLWFIALMPLSAGAVAPFVIGGAIVGVGIVGVSIWRTVAPVDMKSALDFFTSCWTCQIFSDVMVAMSDLLPVLYRALAYVILPMTLALFVVLYAWKLMSGYINGKTESGSKLMGNFGSYIVKLCVASSLLLMPLPRLITNIFIEPAVSIGTSLDYVVSDNNAFSECMVATAIADPVAVSAEASSYGAFSPKLRHQLACEVANVHQVTGLGMTVGWTLLNMSFNADYMHKILEFIPIFPNIPIFFAGLLILVLYFFALLPILLYFLEIFIKLSMDLVMLPFMLMAWVFDSDGFAIFPQGGQTIRKMIDDFIKAIVGIALTIVFLTFSIMFINAAFGEVNNISVLATAIQNNDSKFLMDGLVLNNDSLVVVILMGIFFAMFMTMIPQLTSMLFKIKISDKYYQTLKQDLNILCNGLNNLISGKKTKSSSAGSGTGSSGGGGSFGGSTTSSSPSYTPIEYLESYGSQYIDTDFMPNNDTAVYIKAVLKGGSDEVLFGVKDNSNAFLVKKFHGGVQSSLQIEHGSFSGTVDTGTSLLNELISVDMTAYRTKILDNSGVEIGAATYSTTAFGISDNIYLFALNDSRPLHRTSESHSSCKLYGCSIYNNGRTVRLFIPVLDSSGRACLYDTIQGKFYYNEGSGTFGAGPVI